MGKYARKWASNNRWRRFQYYGKKLLGGAAGGTLGFIAGNIPGAVAGARYGWYRAGPKKFKPIKGKHVFSVNKGAVYGSNPHRTIGSNPPPRYGSNPHRTIGSNPHRPIGSNPPKGGIGIVVGKGRRRFVSPFYLKKARKTFSKRFK